jgi:hypothetical protein
MLAVAMLAVAMLAVADSVLFGSTFSKGGFS